MTKNIASRPNILYIMSDQHAARVMHNSGDSAADTPNLDRLAGTGAKFSRAYCPSPICLPSRMSMLTGLRPHEQQCWTNDDVLDSSHPTWLHGLGAAGYKPVLIGRMHSLGPDQHRGYSSRLIGDHSPTWPGVLRRSLGVLAKTSGPFRESIENSGAGQSSYQLMDEDVLKASVNYLQNYAASGSDEPFCLSASFMLPHPPYVARQEDIDAVKKRVTQPILPIPNDEHAWIAQWRKSKLIDDVDKRDILKARVGYYALVRQLDRMIGELLQTLEDIGCADNTLIVYVSDHGDHIGERGLFWKHTFYEESINVPLILSWKGQIEPNQTISTPIETGGLGNTMLSLVGAPELPNSTMGSFSDLIINKKPCTDKPVFIEYCTDDLPKWSEGFAVQQRAVISGDFKYVYYEGYEDQLFDLSRDKYEVYNLVHDSDYKEIVDSLKNLVLKDWNPTEIAETIEKSRANKKLLQSWASITCPDEPLRWQLNADQNQLNRDYEI